MRNAIFAIMDIDRFKSIHASLGDKGGDDILTSIAERLTRKLGSRAQIFRVGGDAFAVLALHGGSQAAALGAEIVDLCSKPFVQQGRDVFATASVGVARGDEAEDPFGILKNAELALSQAKRQGGGCARLYNRDFEAFAPGDAVLLEADLRRALDEDQLDLYYQPIVHVHDGSVAGFEALLRWRHPVKGLLMPSEFIGHAEETGLIVSLGRFALTQAARDLGDWQRYFPLDPPLFVSVNLSRRQLRDSQLKPQLTALLADSDLIPGTLKLEITESAVASNDDDRQTLTALKSLGVGLAIDDFGTGLSALSQLQNIPFDVLKIDKGFLDAGQGNDAVILESMVSMAHEMGRHVVVEGVETETEAARVKATNCEYAQGFFYSPPLPGAGALNFIAKHYQIAQDVAKSGASSAG
jgi:diguanylate cyclase (GGDEF)-like protein